MWEPNSLVEDSNLVLLITKWSCRVSCCTRAKKLKTWNWLPFASNCGKWEAVFHDLVLWSSQIIEFNNKNDISSIKFKVANWFLSSDSQRQKFSVKKKKKVKPWGSGSKRCCRSFPPVLQCVWGKSMSWQMPCFEFLHYKCIKIIHRYLEHQHLSKRSEWERIFWILYITVSENSVLLKG